MSSHQRLRSSANRRGLQINFGSLVTWKDDSKASYEPFEDDEANVDYDIQRNERDSPRKRQPPVPEDAKLPKYAFEKVIENGDTQIWFNLKESTRKAIASACNQLDPQTKAQEERVANEAVQFMYDAHRSE